MWPGIPDTYQKLPESDSGSFQYTRSRDYQTPTRHALLGSGRCRKTNLKWSVVTWWSIYRWSIQLSWVWWRRGVCPCVLCVMSAYLCISVCMFGCVCELTDWDSEATECHLCTDHPISVHRGDTLTCCFSSSFTRCLLFSMLIVICAAVSMQRVAALGCFGILSGAVGEQISLGLCFPELFQVGALFSREDRLTCSEWRGIVNEC